MYHSPALYFLLLKINIFISEFKRIPKALEELAIVHFLLSYKRKIK